MEKSCCLHNAPLMLQVGLERVQAGGAVSRWRHGGVSMCPFGDVWPSIQACRQELLSPSDGCWGAPCGCCSPPSAGIGVVVCVSAVLGARGELQPHSLAEGPPWVVGRDGGRAGTLLNCGGCQGFCTMERTEEYNGPDTVCSMAQPSWSSPGISSSHQWPNHGLPSWAFPISHGKERR